jgi:transcriptional regulator with XRE-family HTH domain
MGIAEKIKILLIKRNMSQKTLAETLGLSPESLNNKLRRETFKPEELETIAATLNARYTFKEWFTLNDTGEEI